MWCVVYFVGKLRILVHSFLRSPSCLFLGRFDREGVWCSLCLGDLREDGHDTLATLGVCLLLLLENPLMRIVREGGGLDLRCRLSPGFHQKVETGSLRGYVSSWVRVGVRSRILLTPASIALVFGSACVLL